MFSMKHLALIAILFSVFGSCFAQTGTWMVQVEANFDASKLQEANADLSQIEIDFCDHPGEKTIGYTVIPGWKQDICFKATNSSDKDIDITINFVDGTVTNDQRKNKACMQQNEIQKFWQYVTGYIGTFTVPAKNLTYQHATVQLPKAASWTINGCLVYYTKGVEMGGQMNFTVLMRKAKFIDMTIQPKIQSLKFTAVWAFLGVLVLVFFFTKFRAKPKKLPKK